jgi:P4 family phage/plasmid primase-like protien
MIPPQLQKVGFRFCKLRGKVPFEDDWQNTKNYSYNDPELNEWMDKGNIGVVTGYNLLLVLDFDEQEYYDKFKDKLPETLTINSGGRGLPHLYYIAKDCDSAPNRKVGKLDLKGLGGQIVCSGSKIRRENGSIGEYTVSKDLPIADISYKLLKELFNLTEEIKSVDTKSILEGVAEGSRNESLYKLACSLVSKGVSKADILAVIANANDKSLPKLSVTELVTIRDSAWKHHKPEEKKVLTPIHGLKIDNYMDNVELFYRQQPFFYDRNALFWWWSNIESCYEMIDDVDLMNLIDEELSFGGQTVSRGIKTNYMEAFKRVGRKHLPKTMPISHIQFKNKIIDLETGIETEASPEYFNTNPIPWKIGDSDETPIIDRLFTEWTKTQDPVVAAKNKKQLYEIIAYCIIPNYPIHVIISLVGSGRNGKSSFLQIIKRFVGKKNITSTELDVLLESRFESAKLYKKLVCVMGETNYGVMNKTNTLKCLTGQDLISFEFKNKIPFTDQNYAKIIIASNTLPASNDTTEGFYRRWIITLFDNIFPEGKEITKTIPDVEYENLARKSIKILQDLLDRGSFSNQGSIEERKQQFILVSNPISLFLAEHCDVGEEYYVKSKDLYHAYVQYLHKNKRRIIKKKEFGQVLSEEGFQAERTERKVIKNDEVHYENSYWFDGLRLKSIPHKTSLSAYDSHSFSYAGEVSENLVRNVSKYAEISDKTNLFEHLEAILQEKPDLSLPFDRLLELGFLEADIDKWKNQRLIFEPRAGIIRLL